MRDQLTQYVNLLFAGATDCDDMKQEILQNTLDRYDDLIAQGKVPEAAYRLAIAGIGDLGEILGTTPASAPAYTQPAKPSSEPEDVNKKKLRATAIALYILCPIPLFLASEMGSETVGLCGLLVIVAVATALMILSSKKEESHTGKHPADTELTPKQLLRKRIKRIINTAALVLFVILSLRTQLWHITWLVFPIAAALWQLVCAILDLMEANEHEK